MEKSSDSFIELDIPGSCLVRLGHLVLDFAGTLSVRLRRLPDPCPESVFSLYSYFPYPDRVIDLFN